MRQVQDRFRSLVGVFLAGSLSLGNAALAEGPALQDCALMIPDSGRIANYQLLAPQLSFDGQFLAYETLIGERRELYISNTSSWDRFQVKAKPNELFKKKEAFESELDWLRTPGLQNWFVFVTGERNNFDIYLADATRASKPIPLVTWDSNDHQPVFSPDGKNLAFISTKDRSEGTDLYVILDVDRKFQDPTADLKPIKLTSSATGILYPAWSHDSQFLAVTIEETENNVLNDGISVIQFGKLRANLAAGTDASDQATLIRATSPEVFAGFEKFDEVGASWSPDGTYLSFYLSEHAGGRRSAKKDERIQSNLGLIQVKSFDGNVTFAGLEKVPLLDKALDPNADSFLRGPIWSQDSKWVLIAKDAPEQDNPIRIVSVPSGESTEEGGTKLNRDLFAAAGQGGSTSIFFSAHDRQTTSIYRCELR